MRNHIKSILLDILTLGMCLCETYSKEKVILEILCEVESVFDRVLDPDDPIWHFLESVC